MTLEQKKAVAACLESIRAKSGGVLLVDDVIAAAKNPKSPLHRHFTWDVKKAAAERWREEARDLIQTVRVEVHTDTRVFSAPHYVRDPRVAADEQGYAQLMEIKDEKSIAREALLYEFKRARAALERVVDIADALGVGGEALELMKKIDILQLKIAA